MSFNKFLGTAGGGSVTDGSLDILGKTISATNLSSFSSLKTGATGIINTTQLLISDTSGLQVALDAKLNNPSTADLDLALFDLKNVTDLEFKTGDGNAITYTPPAVGSTQSYTLPTVLPGANNILQSTPTGVLSWIPEAGTGDVDSSSIPSVDNRITLFDSTSGTLIKEASTATITSGVLNDDLLNLDIIGASKLRLFNDAGTQFAQFKVLDLLGSNFLHILDPAKTINNGFLTCSSVGNMIFSQQCGLDVSGNIFGCESLTLDTASNSWTTGGVLTTSTGVSSQALSCEVNCNINSGGRIRFQGATSGNRASFKAEDNSTTYEAIWPSSWASANNEILVSTVTTNLMSFKSASTLGIDGDVSASINFANDNRLVRSDAVAPSKDVQQSGVILDDSNNMSGLNAVSTAGASGLINLTTTNATAAAIALQATSGSIDVDSQDFNLLCNKTSSDANLTLSTIGNVSDTISITAITSTSVNAIRFNAIAGGISMDSGGSGVIDINGVITDTTRDISNAASIGLKESGGGSNHVTLFSGETISTAYGIVLPTDVGVTNNILQSTVSGASASLNWVEIPYPPMFISDMNVQWNSVTQVSIIAGSVRDEDDSFNIAFTGAAKTATITTVGAGGLQTGSSEASDTWYKVYVIADSTGVNAVNTLLTPQGTAAAQTGYDKFRLLGHVRNSAASNFLHFTMHGKSRTRHVTMEETRTLMTMKTTAGPSVGNTFQELDISAFVPAGTSRIDMQYNFDMDADGDKLFISSGINNQTVPGEVIQTLGLGIQTADFGFLDSIVYNLALDPTGPSFDWGATQTGDATEFVLVAYIQNL